MAEVTLETAKRIEQFYDSTLSLYEIAKLAKCDHTTVWRSLRLLGLPTLRVYKPTPHDIPELDPIWKGEFRGMFYADGYAGLTPRNPRPNGTVSPRMAIVLRADDRPMLEDVQAKLGGSLYDMPSPTLGKNSYTNVANPRVSWSAFGFSLCKAIIEATDLHMGLLPHRKVKDVNILYDAIMARFSMPRDRLTDGQKALLWTYYDELKAVKRFSC